MWVMYFFLSYLALALLIPTGLALGGVWRRARGTRAVTCPRTGTDATIWLDACHAVRMHAAGDPEAKIDACSRWPGRATCECECLVQIGAAV